MKRFLVVINTMGRAGAERALISMLKSIPPERYSVDLLSIIDRGEMFEEVPPFVRILNKSYSTGSVMDAEGKSYLKKTVIKSLFKRGLFIRYIPHFIRNFFSQLFRGQMLLDKLFWKLLAQAAPRFDTEYDLVIGYTEGAATYYAADYVNAKLRVAFVHIDYAKAGYFRKFDYKYYEKMYEICCVADTLREGFCKVYPEFAEKTRVFLNIVIPDELREKAMLGPGFTDDFDGLRILTVARLHPQKAIDVSITAFARLIAEGYDNIRWYVVGEGAERPMLEALIEKNGLEGKFILLGAVQNPYPYFKNCDIYVQASHFEGRVIAVSEAITLKRPVISSRVSGAEELISSGENGLIIDLTEDNLVEALKKLIDNPELRESFTKNLELYSVDYTRDLKRLYELLNERKRPR